MSGNADQTVTILYQTDMPEAPASFAATPNEASGCRSSTGRLQADRASSPQNGGASQRPEGPLMGPWFADTRATWTAKSSCVPGRRQRTTEVGRSLGFGAAISAATSCAQPVGHDAKPKQMTEARRGVIDSPETHVAPLEAPLASYGHPASTRHSTTTKKGATVRLLDQLVEERAELSETVDGMLTRAADESRDLTEAEDKNLADLKARADALDERITELRAIQVQNLEAAKLRAEVAATDEPESRAAAGIVNVTSDPLTYSEHRSHSFFTDMYHAQTYGDRDAQARLERHREEMAVEHRDGSTANYAGLVVPQYLTQLAAELLVRAAVRRPVQPRSLPADGLTVNISRTTG